jgi:hypothetical protein
VSETLWWLSFANPGEPLGVAIVRAADVVAAIRVAHALGINPGGEVFGLRIVADKRERLSFSLDPYMDRLMPDAEARQLAARIDSELSS